VAATRRRDLVLGGLDERGRDGPIEVGLEDGGMHVAPPRDRGGVPEPVRGVADGLDDHLLPDPPVVDVPGCSARSAR
jgi:hypothetical protein